MEEVRSFRIDRCIGRGGFGEVYLARMRSTGGVESDVALKVLNEGLDPRSQAVQRLRDEGRLLGALNHPAILKVSDIVLLNERVALVMEYVPGLDLEGCFELRPPIGLRAGAEVCAQVAMALDVAWSQPGDDGPLHLVHRDIKPSNIRLGMHGDVKLLDFGIAKAQDAKREARTQTRVTLGSPWYMAPERFDGVNDSPASDVYALGCTLFEVASGGARLFDMLGAREHFLLTCVTEKHDAHLDGLIRPLGLPAPVDGLLRATLDWNRDNRPTAAELGTALDDLAEGLDGPSLRRWVRTITFPEPPDEEGVLVGLEITEHRLSGLISVTGSPTSEADPGRRAPRVTEPEPPRPPARTTPPEPTYAVGHEAPPTLPPPEPPADEPPVPTALDTVAPRLPAPTTPPMSKLPERRPQRSNGGGFLLVGLFTAFAVTGLVVTMMGGFGFLVAVGLSPDLALPRDTGTLSAPPLNHDHQDVYAIYVELCQDQGFPPAIPHPGTLADDPAFHTAIDRAPPQDQAMMQRAFQILDLSPSR